MPPSSTGHWPSSTRCTIDADPTPDDEGAGDAAPDVAARETLDLLRTVTSALPDAEERDGQQQMARLVAKAMDSGSHLVVQAGTGTGKSLAYLVPALVAARRRRGPGDTNEPDDSARDHDAADDHEATQHPRVVVVTATKALQDQLANKDLPTVVSAFDGSVDVAVLKGRSNYLCLQRLDEITSAAENQLDLEGVTTVAREQVKRLSDWVNVTKTGDIADLPWAPADATWRAVSVSSDECPGANRCPQGAVCFAERARQRAAQARITVVNTHLYGLDVASGGAVLPEHDAVVFDEAHVLEDIMSDTVGVQINPNRFNSAAATVRRILDDPKLIGAIEEIGSTLDTKLAPLAGKRIPVPLPDDLADLIADARLRVGDAVTALTTIETNVEDAKQRRLRANQVATRLIGDIDRVIAASDSDVVFVSGTSDSPRLELAPLDVGPTLHEHVWEKRPAILTSATIPASLPQRVGLGDTEIHDVGSPFDYENHGLLYCAMHLPDPRSDDYRAAVHDELEALIEAAGGRTLALFTSWKAMDAAATELKSRLDVEVLTQRDLPKPALIERFSAEESTCLFATMGLFQGVDVPGRTLSLVTIDRLPFPRPDDPLLSARRDRLGRNAFGEIDLPRASMLLAQAAGRLIRNATDRGAVAVFDSRFGTARYRWDIVNALPPMRRTRHRAEVEQFLAEITA